MRETAWKVGLLLGITAGLIISVAPRATASRNSSGTYSLPNGNPVVTGTTITSTWANTTLSDIGSELTNSLDRNGRGAMQAPLPLSNGSVSAPSLTFGTDTNTGMYRVAADNAALAAGGVKVFDWTASALTAPVPLTVTGTSTNDAVTATGGATSGRGIVATGTGSGVGGHFVGGASAHGAIATASAGSAHGFFGTGGSSAGAGVYGLSSNASGIGVVGQGVSGSYGGVFTSSATNIPVLQSQGYIDLDSSSYPASSDSIKDKVTPWNIAKVAGRFNPATGVLASGHNITSIACSSGVTTVTIAQDFAAADYAVLVTLQYASGGTARHAFATLVTSGSFAIDVLDAAHNAIVVCADIAPFSFVAFGIQ